MTESESESESDPAGPVEVLREARAQFAEFTGMKAPQGTGWLANISLLVARDSADTFRARVGERGKADPQLELRVNGSLPAYSFVEPVTETTEAV